nr:retrovirus-related Pol polyprotein from transposon TNT 1-94 [Tanacetum cinerariifolium]
MMSSRLKTLLLVVVDDYSRYTWVFFLHLKDEASEVIISFIKKTQVNLQLQVRRVRADNGTEFKNKTLAKFLDKLKEKGDIRVFIGYSKESASFRIYNKRTRKIHESVNVNFDEILEMAYKQFSLETGIMKSPTTNVETSNNKIPSHEEEVFHEVSESCQEESSSCSLNDDVQQSSKEVSAMQDELDQFARLKVWRLVPRSEGKTIIKTKCIFKNKKDESNLVIQNKARLVAVGYYQQEGIDYDETFALVA